MQILRNRIGGTVIEFAAGLSLLKACPKPRHLSRTVAVMSSTVLFAQLAMAESSYTVVAVSNGGTIQGVVKLAGAAPTIAPIVVTKNQDYCGDSIANPLFQVG